MWAVSTFLWLLVLIDELVDQTPTCKREREQSLSSLKRKLQSLENQIAK